MPKGSLSAMKRTLILLLPLLLCLPAGAPREIPNPPTPPFTPITITRVIDGDTLEVTLEDGTVEKVRLLFVNTEESVHPDRKRNTAFGKETSDHVRELLTHESGGLPGFLEFEDGRRRGRYGRLLSYVFPRDPSGTANLNLYLVRQGYSPYYTLYGRSGRYHDEFEKAEAHARDRRLGIWSGRESGR
jgi:micrococcal nuclease